eukprot:tig00000455_g1004.t1
MAFVQAAAAARSFFGASIATTSAQPQICSFEIVARRGLPDGEKYAPKSSKPANKDVKKGDSVVVISGSEKGKEGKVISRTGDYLVVESVNVATKHVKPNRRAEEAKGNIVTFEAPIHASNVKKA